MYFYLYNLAASLNQLNTNSFNNSHQKPYLSEILLKRALSEYNEVKQLGLTDDIINHIKMKEGLHGKPYFTELIHERIVKSPVHFSISHSGQWWACILGSIPVGLDIEDRKPIKKQVERKKSRNYLGIAKRFFTEKEYEYIIKNGEDSFYDIWVRKEAFIKMKGTGLSEGLANFELLQNGKLANYINGAYFSEIKVDPNIKAVYCAEKQIEIKHITEVYE